MDILDNNFGITSTTELEGSDFSNFVFEDDAPLPVGNQQTSEENKEEKETTETKTVSDTPPQEDQESEIFDPLDDESDDEDVTEDENNESTSTESSEEGEAEVENSTIKDFSQNLYDIGFFTQTEEDKENPIDSEEKLLARLEKEKALGANQLIYNLVRKVHGQKGIDAFNSIFIKGVDPQEYFGKTQAITSFKNLAIEGDDNLENQKAVYRRFFEKEGLSHEEIEKDLEREITYGDLEEKAKRYHRVLVAKEEQELATIEAQRQAEVQQKQIKDNQYREFVVEKINEKLSNKDFDGIPFTQNDAQGLYDFVTTVKWQMPGSGEYLTDLDKWYLDLKNPDNWENKLKVALLAMNNFDLSKVQKKAVSNKKKEMFSSLTNKNKTTTKKTIKENKDNDLQFFMEGL